MQPEDLVGQTIGHYRVKEQVGQGGMATVYLAEDIHLGREVAIKAFLPKPGDTQDFLRRFAREARVLAQLDHPQILPVYDYGEQQGELAYLVTPYLSGGSLKDMLQERKVLPPSEAVKLLDGVLSALQYAHDRNLIHRDLKPGNLLFKADGTLVLADFGLAKVVEGDNQGRSPLMTVSMTTDSIAGTPEYMAPEQIEGKVVPASDIYAIGIVLYEMVTGLRPFTGTSLLSILMKHIQEQPRPPREVNPYISAQLETVILRALEKDLTKRFARPSELQQALAPTNNLASNRASNPGIGDALDKKTSLADPFVPSNNPPNKYTPDALSSPGHGGSLITFGTEQSYTSGQVNPYAQPSQPGLDVRPTELNTYNRGQVPGANNFSAQAGQSGTQQTAASSQPGWGNNIQAQPQNPGVISSPQNMYQQNPQPTPGMFSSPQNANMQYPQQTPGIVPIQQNMNAPMGYPASGQVWGQTQMPMSPPAPRRKRTPIVVMILLLILLAVLVTSLFTTSLGHDLLNRGQATATSTTVNRYSTPTTGTGTATTPQTQNTPTPPSSNATQPMPNTSTDCPASGTARAAVIAPLQRGHDPTIVYLVNDQNPDSSPLDGTVKIIDTANQHKTELAKISQAEITEAQVSNDGQWVLFVAKIADQFQLRLVRLDGTGLQTLTCTSGNVPLSSTQWSLDQKHVVFNEYPQSGKAVLYLLTMQTGALQVEIKANDPGVGVVEVARTWLDNSHVLLTGMVPNSDAGNQDVFLLDINQGTNQNPSNVPVIYANTGNCWNFDSSYDGSKLFVVNCNPGQPTGSSTITVQAPVHGSSPTTILNSSTEAFDTIRIINQQNTMLAVASDTAMGGPNGDPAHDGLYLIKTNGNIQPLFTPATGAYYDLNGYSQYFWSNVSRDGSQYALESTVFGTGSSDYTLYYGSLNGGAPTSFVDYNQPVAIVGWTTI